MPLPAKINLSVAIAAVVTMLAAYFISAEVSHNQAQEKMLDRARVMMDIAIVVQSHTLNEQKKANPERPKLTERPGEQTQSHDINPQALQALLARFPEFNYQLISSSTVQQKSRANSEEARLITHFMSNDDSQELTGEWDTPSGAQLYLARPIRDGNCMGCNNRSKKASNSLPIQDGSSEFPDAQKNAVTGIQIVSMPHTREAMGSITTFALSMGFILAIFTALAVRLNQLMHSEFIEPMRSLSKLAEEISTEALHSEEIPAGGTDEMKSLTKSFNRLHRSLKYAAELIDEPPKNKK